MPEAAAESSDARASGVAFPKASAPTSERSTASCTSGHDTRLPSGVRNTRFSRARRPRVATTSGLRRAASNARSAGAPCRSAAAHSETGSGSASPSKARAAMCASRRCRSTRCSAASPVSSACASTSSDMDTVRSGLRPARPAPGRSHDGTIESSGRVHTPASLPDAPLPARSKPSSSTAWSFAAAPASRCAGCGGICSASEEKTVGSDLRPLERRCPLRVVRCSAALGGAGVPDGVLSADCASSSPPMAAPAPVGSSSTKYASPEFEIAISTPLRSPFTSTCTMRSRLLSTPWNFPKRT
mmetsp:Transcript_13848/g.57845  ORF Transcript_13848/g.57845 Transcript_13848/m.57845 type:complete len:300 (+) Transcript_13848:1354-2253(+)